MGLPGRTDPSVTHRGAGVGLSCCGTQNALRRSGRRRPERLGVSSERGVNNQAGANTKGGVFWAYPDGLLLRVSGYVNQTGMIVSAYPIEPSGVLAGPIATGSSKTATGERPDGHHHLGYHRMRFSGASRRTSDASKRGWPLTSSRDSPVSTR